MKLTSRPWPLLALTVLTSACTSKGIPNIDREQSTVEAATPTSKQPKRWVCEQNTRGPTDEPDPSASEECAAKWLNELAPGLSPARLCEERWIHADDPAPVLSQACAIHWLSITNPDWNAAEFYGPFWGQRLELRHGSATWSRLATEVRKACESADHTVPCYHSLLAADWFDGVAKRYRNVEDNETTDSYGHVIKTILAGKSIAPYQLYLDHELAWSPLALWKMEHAVRARHGATWGPEKEDLNEFFYGPDAIWNDELKPKPNPDFDESMLDAIDRENLRLIDIAQRRGWPCDAAVDISSATPTDLDGDGDDEYIVEDTDGCGTGACPSFVYTRCSDDRLRAVGELDCWDALKVADSNNFGWRDIHCQVKDGRRVETVKYEFNSWRYEPVHG